MKSHGGALNYWGQNLLISSVRMKFFYWQPLIPNNSCFGYILEVTIFGRLPGPFRGVLGGRVGLKMKITRKILTGKSRRFRWYPMSQVGAEIWDFQKFRVVSPKISGIQGFWGPFGLHSEAGGVVNESKRCSNDLKWSHMPSNGSKKPPLAFFKKSPKFSGNFIPKNSGMKQIAAP